MNFEVLVNTIQQTHSRLQQSAIKSVNKHLTIRNWLIGFYIVEFEQKGLDRATYGIKLLQELALAVNVKGLAETNLKLSRQFYLTYPQISQTLSSQLKQLGFNKSLIRQLPTDELDEIENQSITISQSETDQLKKSIPNALHVPPDKIIDRLSFTHLVQLFSIDDPLKRTFYEIECMKGNWNVKELKRQIYSLYFERSGMSTKRILFYQPIIPRWVYCSLPKMIKHW